MPITYQIVGCTNLQFATTATKAENCGRADGAGAGGVKEKARGLRRRRASVKTITFKAYYEKYGYYRTAKVGTKFRPCKKTRTFFLNS
jgi:hypothetical protein